MIQDPLAEENVGDEDLDRSQRWSESRVAESGAGLVVQVRVYWGDASLLHLSQVQASRSFFVGESHPTLGPADYAVAAETLGVSRLPVVVADEGGPSAVIPEGASGYLFRDGVWLEVRADDLSAYIGADATGKCREKVRLRFGERVRVEYAGFVFVSELTNGVGGRPWAGRQRRSGWGTGLVGYLMGATAFAGALLLAMYLSPPWVPSLNVDLLADDSRMMSFLLEAQERPDEEPLWANEAVDSSNSSNSSGPTEVQDADDASARRETIVAATTRRGSTGGAQGPRDARAITHAQASRAGVVAALREVAESWTPSGSPFAADSALSGDAIGALGALRGGEPGEYFSLGGLASPGSGRCGGCRSGWGSIERGAYQTMGLSTGQESGASLVGEAFSRRETRVPQIRSGVAQVRGDLSREVVRRVVRRNVSQVRACYEQQLISRPDLEGRVTVSFIISPTGATQTSVLASSSLGNSAAEQCIVRAVRRWSFPAPTGGGVVRVNYPFTLSRMSR